MADEKRITRQDMQRAAARIAARDGISVEELRANVRRMEDRECASCARTFASSNVRKRFCSDSCRAKSDRANGEGDT